MNVIFRNRFAGASFIHVDFYFLNKNSPGRRHHLCVSVCVCVDSSDAVSVDDFTGSFLYERATAHWADELWRYGEPRARPAYAIPTSSSVVCVFGKKRKTGTEKKARCIVNYYFLSAASTPTSRRMECVSWGLITRNYAAYILCQTTLARLNWSIVKICTWNTFVVNWVFVKLCCRGILFRKECITLVCKLLWFEMMKV